MMEDLVASEFQDHEAKSLQLVAATSVTSSVGIRAVSPLTAHFGDERQRREVEVDPADETT